MNLDELNKEQKEAVLHTDGPLLVLAGAGSGKTKVLTTKIAYLIQEKGVSPYNILAITFTNKAANEMKSRIERLIGRVASDCQISTFHSFGVKIIRDNAAALGYTYNFNIIDSDDSITIVKRILREMNLDPKQFNPTNIRNKISSCKNEMMSVEEYSKYAVGELERITAEVYKKYDEKLKKSDSVDFDDLLLLPIKLFKEDKYALDRYQERFKYVLIDEYQDTNEAQYILTKMISAKYKNICCVGDNDQSIYGFRGANYRNILNFEKDYKGAKVIKLEQNYRSTSTILNAANCVIKNNTERKDKNLWSVKGEGEKISYFRAFNEKDEAFYVIREIKKAVRKGIDYKDIAVIFRTNAQSRALEEAFVRENVPYHIVGGLGFYARKEIKDLLAYLKLINNTNDDISLARVINTPKRGIGAKTVSNIEIKARDNNISMFDAILTGKEYEFKKLILELIEDSKDMTLTELIENILVKTGIRKEYEDEKSLESDIRLENLEEFKTITQSFEDRDGVISLSDFLLEISLLTDVNENKDNKDTVNLMTVHSVKGLEFKYVFVVGLEEGIFPHINSLMNGKLELEEERRLCYVAITRAKEKLYFVNARMRSLYGNSQSNLPSRFIDEVDEDLINKEFKEEKQIYNEVESPSTTKVENEYTEDVEFNIGDNVFHEIFGQGKVLEVGDKIVTIAFKHPYGIKKLIKNHKSINKI